MERVNPQVTGNSVEETEIYDDTEEEHCCSNTSKLTLNEIYLEFHPLRVLEREKE